MHSSGLPDLIIKLNVLQGNFELANSRFEAMLAKFRSFMQLLRCIMTSSKESNLSEKTFLVIVFFYLIAEKCGPKFLLKYSSYFFSSDFQKFEDVFDLDLIRLDFRQINPDDIDYLFKWILDNPNESTSGSLEFVDPVVQEKFQKENSLETLHLYTENSKNINLDILFEGVKAVMSKPTGLKKQKYKRGSVQKITEAVRDFLLHFKKDELFFPLERYLKLGFCAISTHFCDKNFEKDCPTCCAQMKNVFLKGRQTYSKTQQIYFHPQVQIE